MQMVSQILFTIEIRTERGYYERVLRAANRGEDAYCGQDSMSNEILADLGAPYQIVKNFAHVKFSNPLPPPIPSNFGAAPGPLSASA